MYETTLFLHLFVLAGVWLVWIPWLESRNGRTAFKSILKLKVIQDDGSKVSFDASLLRHLLDPADLFFLFGVVGTVLARFSTKHQRLGDMLAQTCVILEDGASGTSPAGDEWNHQKLNRFE